MMLVRLIGCSFYMNYDRFFPYSTRYYRIHYTLNVYLILCSNLFFEPYLEVKLIVFIEEAHSKNGGFDTCWGAAQTWYEWESNNNYFQQVPNYWASVSTARVGMGRSEMICW